MQLRLAHTRPRVLIFDDDEAWAKLVARSIHNTCDAIIAHTIDRWTHEVSGQHWDAMVMDVQIPGSPKTGTDHAEQAIWEYWITSPIIVISVGWRLEAIKRKHPGIFFDFIPKDDLRSRLPESINRAYSIDTRSDHVKRMLTSFARKFGILKKEFPIELLDTGHVRQLFKSSNGKTIEDLINMIWGGTKNDLNNVARAVFSVMREIFGRST